VTFSWFHLQLFVHAQDKVWPGVIAELRRGRKESHWMWFVFPQLKGLGSSAQAQRFAIASVDEARTYLDHFVLGARLRECTTIVLDLNCKRIADAFDYPDDLKFRSCMTLFSFAAPEEAIFQRAIETYFDGQGDPRTLELLGLL
jgi:uncharacterized protein (DUF1810 family)